MENNYVTVKELIEGHIPISDTKYKDFYEYWRGYSFNHDFLKRLADQIVSDGPPYKVEYNGWKFEFGYEQKTSGFTPELFKLWVDVKKTVSYRA